MLFASFKLKNYPYLSSFMQVINQYIETLETFKVKKSDIVAILGGSETKLYRFYEQVLLNKWKTDQAVFQILYESSNETTTKRLSNLTGDERFSTPMAISKEVASAIASTIGTNTTIKEKEKNEAIQAILKIAADVKAYSVLKSEFKKRLINCLSLSNLKESNLDERDQASFQTHKTMFAMRVMSEMFKMDAAAELALTTFDTAMKYEFTAQVMFSARFLANYKGLHQYDKRKSSYFMETYSHYHEMEQAEQIAENYTLDFTNEIRLKRIPPKEIEKKAIAYFEEISGYMTKFKNNRIHFLGGLIGINRYTLANDYESALLLCEQTIAFMEKKPFELKKTMVVLLHKQSICCAQLKLYEKGLESVNKSAKLVIVGTLNWYNDGFIAIQLSLHTKQYKSAWDVLKELKKHVNERTNPVQIENIIIYDAYLNYLVTVKELKISPNDQVKVNNLKISKFLNEVPMSSRDRLGSILTVTIIILAWLQFNNNQKEMDLLFDRIRRNQNDYATRKHNKRAYLMMRMILSFSTYSYNKSRIQKENEKLFDELKSTPISMDSQTYADEILPHEDMYDLIMKGMK
jgi:hypothetical protein